MKTIVKTLLIIAILFDVQAAFAQLRSISADIPIVYNWGDKSSYVMDSGIPNTLEYTQRVKAIDEECFVALSRDISGNFSYLELVKDTTQNEQYMVIPNCIVTDIDIGEKYIYFCGYLIGSPSTPMIGRIYKSYWFTNTATGFEFTLLTSNNTNVSPIDSLTRIKVYRNDNDDKDYIVCLGVRTDTSTSSQHSCIVAIEDDHYVINTLIDDTYMEEIQDIDIAEGGLTTVSFSQKEYDNNNTGFIVRTYDRNNPSDINAYQHQTFDLTNTFYRSILFPQTDRYFIRALGENTAAVFSHAIALNGEDITAMNMIDIVSLQVIWCLGMVHNDKDITIRDVNFSEDKDYLFLIERIYNPNTNNYNDCEITLKWGVGTQTADAFYFDSYSPIRIPLMNTITPITSSKYLSAGLDINTNTNCFHILDFNNSNGTCEQSFNLNVVPQPTSPTGNTFNGFVQYDNDTCNWLQYYSTNTSTIHTHCSN